MPDAELLVDIANKVLRPKRRIVLCINNPANAVDVVALALRLRERPDLALRAMLEDWDRVRIVRELY